MEGSQRHHRLQTEQVHDSTRAGSDPLAVHLGMKRRDGVLGNSVDTDGGRAGGRDHSGGTAAAVVASAHAREQKHRCEGHEKHPDDSEDRTRAPHEVEVVEVVLHL